MRKPASKSNPAPTTATTPVRARTQFPEWLIAPLLVLVTVGLYCPVTGFDFLNYDDPEFVTANLHVQGGVNWEGIKWAFCNTTQAVYWAPLMWLSHMLVCQLFGLNPWGHHLINVLLHAINTVLVFFVLRRMTRATWRSMIVAALFALHPLRVESVAWVTERKDVLSTFFWMLALWAYVKCVETAQVRHSRSKVWYGTTLAMFLLGLLSKPMVVTLPCVLLLLDYWPLRRMKKVECRMQNAESGDTDHAPRNTLHVSRFTFRSRQSQSFFPLLVEKIPFFVLAALGSVVTFVVQQRGGVVAEGENLPLGARSGNALISYCRYLGKLFWPTDLAVFYPRPEQWPMVEVLLAGGLLLGVSGLLWVRRRRFPSLLMGWLWFLGTLVPVIGLVQSSDQAMADRFTYIPSLGLLILAVWGTCELTKSWRFQVSALSVVGSVVIVLCMVLTGRQLGFWQDSEALFRHALEVTEGNYVAHSGLGEALVKQDHIDEAISHYRESVRLKPDFVDGHYNLAVTLVQNGQIDEAISHYQESLRLKPDSTDAHYNLGNALARKGQIDQAISQFLEAIRLKPDFALAHNNLGNARLRKGQIEQAISQFQEAIRLKPDFALAHNNLGNALYRNGRGEEAISQFQAALRLKPDYADARKSLDVVLAGKASSSRQPGAAPNP